MSSCLFCAMVCPRKFTLAGGQLKKLTVENDGTPPCSFNFGEDSVISEQLKVIFTLKNILGVGHEQLCAFLGSSGKLHPEFWVTVCKPCEETVCKYFEVVKEVRRLEKVLVTLSNELKEKIWRSKEVEGQGPTVMLWDTIRSQVLIETKHLFEEEVEDKTVISESQPLASEDNLHSDPEFVSKFDLDSEVGAEPTNTNDDRSEVGSFFEEEWHLEQKLVTLVPSQSLPLVQNSLSDLEPESLVDRQELEANAEEDTEDNQNCTRKSRQRYNKRMRTKSSQSTVENYVVSSTNSSVSQPATMALAQPTEPLVEIRTTPQLSSSAATSGPNIRTFIRKRTKLIAKLEEKGAVTVQMSPSVAGASGNQNKKPKAATRFTKPPADKSSAGNLKTVSTKMKFSCPKCAVSFTIKGNLDRHIFEKHPTVPKVFRCGSCDAEYLLKRSLLRHLKKH